MDIQKINWSNRNEVLKAVKENGLYIVYAASEFKKDKEILLEAIGSNSEAIREVDKSFLGDKEFMLEAVKRSNSAKNFRIDACPLIYASDELKQDKEFVLEVVRQRGSALQYAEYFKNDKDVVIEAVRKNGFALEDVDKTLKGDKDVVIEAVKKSGYALMYASPELKNDKEIVMTALKQIRKEIDEVVEAEEFVNSALNEIIEDTDKMNEVGEFLEEDRTFEFDCIGEQLLQDEEFMKEAEKIMQGKPVERQHTAEEIAEGISPQKTDIDSVAKEMIEEQTIEKDIEVK